MCKGICFAHWYVQYFRTIGLQVFSSGKICEQVLSFANRFCRKTLHIIQHLHLRCVEGQGILVGIYNKTIAPFIEQERKKIRSRKSGYFTFVTFLLVDKL